MARFMSSLLLSEVCNSKDEVLECIKHQIPFCFSPELQEINIPFDNIGQEMQSLARAIALTKSLQSIGLWGNDIRPDGALHLAEALKVNKSVKALYLPYNFIGDEGAIAIAMALSTNTTLVEISLCNNKITNKGASALLEVLEMKNTTLKWIGIGDNPISEELQDKIRGCVRRNKAATHQIKTGAPAPPPYENFLLGLIPSPVLIAPVMPKVPKMPNIMPTTPLFSFDSLVSATRKRRYEEN